MKPRAVIVHSGAQARAAVAAAAARGAGVVLLSAPGAAASLGAQVFQAMAAEAAAAFPQVPVTAVLDCGKEPGDALNALRHGIAAVRLDAEAAVLDKVRDIAAQLGARLDETPWEALDLLDVADPAAALQAWLDPESA